MERETILTILEGARSCQKEENAFKVKQGYQVAVFLGKPGNAMVIGGVQRLVAQRGYLEITAKNDATIYADFDVVHAISEKPDTADRTGHSGVGFD
jgi:hypothetical protein